MPFLIRTWPLFVGLVAALLFLPGCNQRKLVTVTGEGLDDAKLRAAIDEAGYEVA